MSLFYTQKQIISFKIQINEAFKYKYGILAQYRVKFKMDSTQKMEAQKYFDDDAKENQNMFNICESDLSKTSFAKLGHTKVNIFYLYYSYKCQNYTTPY